MTREYLVQWSIDMEAESHEEAAAKALIVQRDNDPANSATVFKVIDKGNGLGKTVDLSERRKRYSHAFSIAFTLENNHPDGIASDEELFSAIESRIKGLRQSRTGEIQEAVGAPWDTYEIQEGEE